MNKFYITTTLPYVNAEPHIGHALEFIQADVIARFYRQKLGKENVFFNLGTDEHGQKIYLAAKAEELGIRDFVNKYADRFKDFCKLFFIDYDNFYRTSTPEHHKAAQEFWKVCDAAGDIYKKKYGGYYCVGCERFITEKELNDGKCPDHNTEPVWQEEENYFFRLSKYSDQLVKYYEENPEVLKPKSRIKELVNFVKDMEDISISRSKENLPWGIEVPGDPSQVMYVWFDALTNYVNTIGYSTDEEKLKEWWPGAQIFGVDNLRFQGAIWQGMLASAGLPQTSKLLMHGMILAGDGQKMSKSIGNIVSPFEQSEKFGPEIVRYYLIAGLTTFGDASYKEDDLVNLYNANLANNFGNLLNRVIHLANSKGVELNKGAVDEFEADVDKFRDEAHELYSDFELHLAADVVNRLADFGNKYIDENKPWEKDGEEAALILQNLGYLLEVAVDLYKPVLPESCEKASEALEKQEKVILFPRIE